MVQREITMIWCVVLFIALLGRSCVSIHNKYSDADMIRMERFDGYYITNIKPYPDSSLKQVQEGWYVHE